MKTADATAPARPSRLWIWFLAACLIHIGTWALWIAIGAMHPVEEVPLVHRLP